jgi:integrase
MSEFVPILGYKYLFRREPYGTHYILRKQGGKRKPDALGTKDEHEAIRLYELRYGKPLPAGARNVRGDEAIDEFLSNPYGLIKPITVAKHRTTIDCHVRDHLAHLRPSRWTTEMLNTILDLAGTKESEKTGTTLSVSVQKQVRNSISKLCEFCVGEGWIHHSDNPVKGMRKRAWEPKHKKSRVVHRAITKDEVVSQAELEAIIDALGDYRKPGIQKRRMWVRLMELIGTRISECLALKQSDLLDYGKYGALYVERQVAYRFEPKDQDSWFDPILKAAGPPRLVPLTEDARGYLDAYVELGHREGWLQRGGLLFPTERGTPFQPGTIGSDLSTAAKKAGIERRIKSHYLRHTFATKLFAAGYPVEKVAALIGNSKKVCEEVYIGFIPREEEMDAIVEAMERAREMGL